MHGSPRTEAAHSGPDLHVDPRRAWLCRGAIGGQVLFVAGWFLLGLIEGGGYSAGRHDVSDLSALGADHAAVMLVVTGVSGALTMAFALGALRPALEVPAKRGAVAAWLVALSLPSLDNLSDVFFRLDCRAADAGCTMAAATASWHGRLHVIMFVIAAVATIAAPFALARRMGDLPSWGAFARTTRTFGIAVVAGLVITAATSGTGLQGWTQRGVIVFVCSGLCVLAVAVARRPGGNLAS